MLSAPYFLLDYLQQALRMESSADFVEERIDGGCQLCARL